jgi:elongation factor Ts
MKIKTEDVIKLRKETGIPILECRQALESAGGDFKKARMVLSARSEAVAAKKSSRASEKGIVDAYIHADGQIGVLIEVSSETDFVARNAEFKQFVHDMTLQVAATNPKDLEVLLSSEYIKDPSMTTDAYLKSMIAKIGENLKIKRFVRYELGG